MLFLRPTAYCCVDIRNRINSWTTLSGCVTRNVPSYIFSVAPTDNLLLLHDDLCILDDLCQKPRHTRQQTPPLQSISCIPSAAL